MFKKLKKAYVNFTVAFAVPLIVFSNVSGVYTGWREDSMKCLIKENCVQS